MFDVRGSKLEGRLSGFSVCLVCLAGLVDRPDGQIDLTVPTD